ncbi:MAG: hypothetical protein KGI71_04960 [Patescibacteria group bacterium]|nr:hypothetical protein [Patescibacteria group bacterium]
MRVYVAGSWVEQHTRARVYIGKLREAGHTITCDWTQAEGDVCACGHHRSKHTETPIAGDSCFPGFPGNPCSCPGFNGIGVGSDSKFSAEDRRKYALADLNGVLDADLVWLLAANTQGACGSWVEFGLAIASKADRLDWGIRVFHQEYEPRVIVSGLKARRTIFTELADKLFDTDEEAFAWITRAR